MRRTVLAAALGALVLVPTAVAAAGLEHRTLAIASGTAIGGEPERAATEVGSRAAMRKFARRHDVEELRKDLLAAHEDAEAGEAVWVAVVSVGCDVPPGVDVSGTADQVYLDPQPVEEPLPECFAPVTSVAVVAVD